MILADKIIAERKKNGWSQEELAEKLNVSRQSVSKWEGAQSVPDLQRILEMAQLFGVSTDYLLKDELEDTAYVNEQEEAVEKTVRKVTMEEANAFLKVKAQTAPLIALATFLCIISPICLICLGAASETSAAISENAAGGLGMTTLFILIAVAVAIFIFCGAKTGAYEFLEKELIETEYGVTGMVKERKKQFANTYLKCNILGTLFCILGVVPIFVALSLSEADMVMASMVAVLLLLEAIGVVWFIYGGIHQASMDKLLQEGDYTKQAKKDARKRGNLGTIYWLVIVAIYLLISFVSTRWEYSWIVWPVAGVLFPVYLEIIKLVIKGKNND